MEFNSLDELRQLIKAQKTKPSDLFDLDDLAEDAVLKGYIDQIKKNQYGAGAAHLRRTEEEFDKKRKEFEDENAKLKKEIAARDSQLAKAQIPNLFEKVAAARKLEPKQKEFIAPTLDKFEPKKIDEIEKELNLHLDSQLLELKRFEQLYGVKGDEQQQSGEKKDSGSAPEQRKEAPAGDDKYLMPEFNPMIPRD